MCTKINIGGKFSYNITCSGCGYFYKALSFKINKSHNVNRNSAKLKLAGYLSSNLGISYSVMISKILNTTDNKIL